MSDLIKEAIADAKAVREMAVKQAKAALEEAFAPQVDAIISKRLQTEEDDEQEDEMTAPEPEMEEAISPEPGVELGTDDDHEEAKENSGLTEEEELDEVADTSGIGTGDNKEPSAASSDDSTEDIEGEMDVKADHDTAKESELTEDIEEDVDLAQIVKELEDEADEMEDEDEFEAEPEEEEEVEVDMEAEPEEEEAEEEEDELELEIEDDLEGEEAPEGDEEEELDLEALVGEAEAEDEEDELDALRTEVARLKSKLGESLKVVKYQKDRLNEINILNAKLLFTNKVFSEYNLDDASKIKVIENFDRAKTVREIKLIFATLMENMKADKRKVSGKAQRLVEGASKAMGSTKAKSEEPIVGEQDDVRNRVHKLMGFKNK